jgi:O-antigen ligase
MWKKTMLMVKDHPLTGVGTGNWRIVINSYGLGGTIMGKGMYGPDRTHNTYLQIASETGIPGILLYVGMWVLIAIAGFKLVRTTKDDNKKIITILMLSGISALAVDRYSALPLKE